MVIYEPIRERDEILLEYRGEPAEWAERMRDDLDEVVYSGASVVVDLSAAESIDSLTLGTLVLAHKRLMVHGGALTVVCGRSSVLEQIQRVGLDRTMPVHPHRVPAVGRHI